uniref:uncharacterized protein isoform X1 n=2 Tax=Myxine glutinosa TaxID=7769 RepID=UPI00358F6B40
MTSSSTLLFFLLLLAIAMTLQARRSPGRRKTACHQIWKLSKSVSKNIKSFLKNTNHRCESISPCLDSLPEVSINCEHDLEDLCKQILIKYKIVLRHLKEKSDAPPIIQGERNTRCDKKECSISRNIKKLHRKIRQKLKNSGDTTNKQVCSSGQNCTTTPNKETVNCQVMDWKCVAASTVQKLYNFLQDFRYCFQTCNSRGNKQHEGTGNVDRSTCSIK